MILGWLNVFLLRNNYMIKLRYVAVWVLSLLCVVGNDEIDKNEKGLIEIDPSIATVLESNEELIAKIYPDIEYNLNLLKIVGYATEQSSPRKMNKQQKFTPK